jgi:hypothetical protein
MKIQKMLYQEFIHLKTIFQLNIYDTRKKR